MFETRRLKKCDFYPNNLSFVSSRKFILVYQIKGLIFVKKSFPAAVKTACLSLAWLHPFDIALRE